ncbi:glutaminase family protein [Bacteroides sp.]|uniref:glutaminase family protein n=1 Tax=Bacteroides sp. TaxID=29523 RepID=UPI0025B9B052|nr:glutaminase family protein [Bacteroides sp.]
MKKLLAVMAFSTALLVNAQTTGFFKPVNETALRAPSVPILVSDPYFSVWSPYDNLMEGSTEHWTNAKKPLLGALRVDGKVYRFLGKDKIQLIPIAPMAGVERWEASYTNQQPADGWQAFQFDDSSWKKGKAAFGDREMKHIGTEWKGDNTDIYIRRAFELADLDTNEDFYLTYSHDDVFELYLNGEKIVSTDYSWKNDITIALSQSAKAKLRKGTNVIAAHCHNTVGGSYVDFGLYRGKKNAVKFTDEAVQKSVNVLATSSYYTFACGPVELDVVFTAPQLIDDLDLLSTPVNYISYRVRSLDKKEHDVQFYMETTPELAINENTQPTVARTLQKGGISYVEAGSIDQPICDRRGDLICADWGYLYLAGVNGKGKSVSLGDYYGMKESFVKNGTLAPAKTKWITRKEEDMPAMAYVHDLGSVSKEGKDGFMMMGYDDIYSVEYMYEKRMGYWKHDGKVTIFDAFEKLRDNYQSIMERCRALDGLIYDDAEKAGGKKYAEICSAAYRQVISAHKLFTDKEGNLLWFSKENNSNGCINTVDLTYPSAPLFLVYNPDLAKAMMTSIFEYSASGRWNKPFPAHDLGTYPVANGQVYGGDMPIEEGGNMVILAAAVSAIEGNADYAKRYWDLLTVWTDYLAEYGQDPENQLCTDDFAGHWAHNANLSVKAIMGVAGYSEMARMLGLNEVADKYAATARKMAVKWEEMANEGDHYRLAFDRKNTWSQKYNMVWDKMWNLNLFPNNVIGKEINYYLTKQNTYGLALDSRKEYTKSDWIIWSASMSPDKATFEKFIDPLYRYVDETTTRVPISDWHHTDSGEWVGFKARSVIGGYWMKVLMDKMRND